MRNHQPALYFDVTDIVEHAMFNTTVTGIQRSVLRILESLICQGCGRPVYGLVKHPVSGAFKIADLGFMRGPYSLQDFVSRFEIPCAKARWLARKLRNYRNSPIKRYIRECMLKVRWAVSSRSRAEAAIPFPEKQASCLMEPDFIPGSTIVCLGAGWKSDYRSIAELARSHLCKSAALIYDIIPITSPHYAGLSHEKTLQFCEWLEYVSQNYDVLICCSSFTKEEVKKYLAPKKIFPDITVVRLAHEFKAPFQASQSGISRSIMNLAGRRFILCVGTITIRKGNLPLLQAWERLRQVRGNNTPSLVLSGSRGWKADDVYDFLRRTDNIGGTVEIVERPSDTELEFLYRHCEFTVFPSLTEGWGLPIGESLWFGKPVICASQAPMPEVGGSLATYFNGDEPGSLLAALELMLDTPVSLPVDIRSHLTTWDATARSIAAAAGGVPEMRPEQASALSVY